MGDILFWFFYARACVAGASAEPGVEWSPPWRGFSQKKVERHIQFPPYFADLQSMYNSRLTILITVLMTFILSAVAAQPLNHTLQGGETLYGLSRKYGVSVEDIMSANGISSPDSLSIGSRLVIPGTNSEKETDNSTDSLYIVKSGDTFYRIARNHGLSVQELMKLNDFSGNRILKPGERLIVSAGASTGSAGSDVRVQPVQSSREKPVETSAGRPVNYSNQNVWPVDGSKKTLTGKLRGVMIEAAEASLVRSIASGSVVWTGPYRGFGQVILIDVEGYIYLYGGNEDVFVNVGEYVQAGSRIGRLGHSGLASRTVSMYFSVFKDGIPVSVVSAPRG